MLKSKIVWYVDYGLLKFSSEVEINKTLFLLFPKNKTLHL